MVSGVLIDDYWCIERGTAFNGMNALGGTSEVGNAALTTTRLSGKVDHHAASCD